MKTDIIRFFVLTFSILCIVSVAFSQKPTQQIPEKTRILFLLDGSGSMLAKWENTLRINVAKHFLSDFVDSLRVNDDLQLALRVYGHQFDRRFQNCEDTKLEVRFGSNNHDQIIQKLRSLEPKGTTPLAYALEKSGDDFPIDPTYRNIVIIITDGIESCDGDPCAISLALQKKGIFLKPFVIGIGMDENFENTFGCLGQYYDATNINAFKSALNKAVNQSLGRTTVSVELLDENSNKNVSDVNISFINNSTRESVFEFVHFRDQNGRPDSVVIDPVLSYDIVVNTIPPVRKSKIVFNGGRHNTLNINAPQGFLLVDFKGAITYSDPVACLLRDKKSGATITTFSPNTSLKILKGTYDLEILTLPRLTYKNVQISDHETTTLSIPKPGIVNIMTSTKGIGSIYRISNSKGQKWISNLNNDRINNTITLQPGDYKVVFRSEKAKGSKFTKVHNFQVKPGGTLTLKL